MLQNSLVNAVGVLAILGTVGMVLAMLVFTWIAHRRDQAEAEAVPQ